MKTPRNRSFLFKSHSLLLQWQFRIYQKRFFKRIVTKLKSQTVSKFYLVACDDWGRASKKCGGWGLCNAHWFHCSPDPCFGKTNSFPLQFDPKGNVYFIDVLPDSETLRKYSNEDLSSLPVDIDITLSTNEVVGRDLIIPKGNYQIDSETKSYRIYLR